MGKSKSKSPATQCEKCGRTDHDTADCPFGSSSMSRAQAWAGGDTKGYGRRGGRYGKGQVVLLEDSGLLLVAGERGRVFLLKADPAELIELGSFQAIEGKTWNHPVVVGDRLYLRNAQQAACYQFEND